MKHKKHQRNFLRLREGARSGDLGRLVAENDHRLEQYYVEPERYVARALDADDPAIFFMGAKGIGKSAILQMVRLLRKADSKRVIDITPDDLAFSGLANIKAESPILTEPTKNQWIFKSLWDFILSVEILKRECQTRHALVGLIQGIFASKDEKAAQKLLKISIGDEGSPDTITARILSLVRALEANASFMGVDVSLKKKDSSSGRQLQLLSQINHVARKISDLIKHDYYLLIDDLDKHWVNTPTQNEFIAALFMSLRDLNKPPHLKFLVAIRDDIYRRLPLADKDKLRDSVCSVTWDKPAVKKMLSVRLRTTYNCTVPEIWSELFPRNAFDSMWNHSTGRPRELIRLTTLAAQQATSSGHNCVTDEDLGLAIVRFAEERLEDFASEQRHRWPGLDVLVQKCRGWPKEFSVSHLEDLLLIVDDEIDSSRGHPPLYSWAGGYVDNPVGLGRVLAESGIVLVKPNRNSTPHPLDADSPENITSEYWFAWHPMVAPGLQLVGD